MNAVTRNAPARLGAPDEVTKPLVIANTMNSMEIAEVVGMLDRHDNVKRTIETLGEQGLITLPQIEGVSNPRSGPKTISVYVFKGEKGKRDSIVVVARLSPEHTAALVDRWQYLEDQAAAGVVPRPGDGPPLPTDVVSREMAVSGNPMFDMLQGMLDTMRQNDARIARVEQTNAHTVAEVADLRENLPALVSNGQSRALVSEPSQGVASMNKITDDWHAKANLPHDVTERVLRQLKRFRIVATENIGRGLRRHADGSPVCGPNGEPRLCPGYPGYQTGIASRMIEKFLRECVRHPTRPGKATHDEIPDRVFTVKAGFCKGE